MKATSNFEIRKWEESIIEPTVANQKMTRASVEYKLFGQLEGLAKVEYLMFYNDFDPNDRHKGSAKFTGIIWFNGAINGKVGTIAFEDNGDFGKGAVLSNIKIIPGSGKNHLMGFSGIGKYSADEKGMTIEINYEEL